MKLEILLSRLVTVSVFAATVGLALNALALVFFAAAAATFVLLIAAGDYARRPSYAGSGADAFATLKAPRGKTALPLAA
jgi:hypothetical protein